MLAADGYLVRLHFSCGIVTADETRTIADLARRYGNGPLELTRRANMQIRGVTEQAVLPLRAELIAMGLIAEHAEGDDIPNVIASPLAGRDREALIDIRPLVRQLESRLAIDTHARELPAKFCISVEDGGRFALRDVGADIAFEAHQRDRFAVRIGGSEPIGSVETDAATETTLALVSAFTSLRTRNGMPARRMRDLVNGVGLSAITVSYAASGRASTRSWSAHDDVDGRVKAGHDAVGFIEPNVFGVAAPFGSWHTDQLHHVADLAERFADAELRLTPWRAVLIPAIASGAIGRIQTECARAGLITDPSDRRRHVAACVGAPACASASVQTRDMAATLAPLLRPEDTLHVSGCAKSCASSIPASVTLVGRDGRFDLIRNGKAGDTSALFNLSAEDARVAVQRIAAEDLAHV
jgi:precorrin-3B synthase